MRATLLALLAATALPSTLAHGGCLHEIGEFVQAELCDDGSYAAGASTPPVPTGVAVLCCDPFNPDEFVTLCTRADHGRAEFSGHEGAPAGYAGVFHDVNCTIYPSGGSYTSSGRTAEAGLRDNDGDGNGDAPYVILP